jgi:tetratricopeptide (TPR) repeat protein
VISSEDKSAHHGPCGHNIWEVAVRVVVTALFFGLVAAAIFPITTQAQSVCDDDVDMMDYDSIEEWTFDYEDCLELALKRNPRDADSYWRRGEIHADLGELDRALGDFTKAIELNPKRSAFYKSRGDAYEASGEHKLAVADYSKALELDPSDFRARSSRARAYLELGESENAQSDYDHVIAGFTKSIEANPKNQYAYYHRGLVYKERGEHDRAIADLEKALSIDPKLKEAGSALAELRSKGAADSKNKEPVKTRPPSAAASKDEVPQVSRRPSEAAEIAFWESVKDSGDAAMLQAYLDRFPEGVFASLAKIKLEGLEAE